MRVAVIAAAVAWVTLVALVLARIGSGEDELPRFSAGAATVVSPSVLAADTSIDTAPEATPGTIDVVPAPVQPAMHTGLTGSGEAAFAAVVDRREPSLASEQLVFDGQSFNYYPLQSDKRTYPVQLLGLLGARIGVSGIVGISATSYSQRNPSVRQRVDSLYSRARRTTILDNGGQSEILGGMTGAQLFKTVTDYADARHKAGAAYIIEFTITPSDRYSKPEDAERVAYNKLLLSNTGHHVDAVIDLAGRPEFADAHNRTYIEDGMHPTEAGAGVMAAMAQVAVGQLLS